MWKSDTDSAFNIDQDIVKNYFNKTMSLVFDENSARLEEKTLLPYMNITKESRILDVGCANGRWTKILLPKANYYVGIDFSEKFINYTRKKFSDFNCEFHAISAEDFISEKQFDLILLIGLMTYMNDSKIQLLADNCSKMLKYNGRLIVRNVVLSKGDGERKVYDRKPNFLRRLLGRQRYQIIRRSIGKEMEFFRAFELIHHASIPGTSYHFYVYKQPDRY